MANSDPFQESSPATAFKLTAYSPSEQSRLSEQFASYEAFLETRGTLACEHVEIIEIWDIADEEM